MHLWNTPASEALRESQGRFRHLETGHVLLHVATPLVHLFVARTGRTLGPHPLALLRLQLEARGCLPSRELGGLRDRAYV